jgi:hypothetical protein
MRNAADLGRGAPAADQRLKKERVEKHLDPPCLRRGPEAGGPHKTKSKHKIHARFICYPIIILKRSYPSIFYPETCFPPRISDSVTLISRVVPTI